MSTTTTLKNTSTSLENFTTGIEGINFSSTWSGSAFAALNDSLMASLKLLKKEQANIASFETAENLIEELKKIIEQIEKKKQELSSLQASLNNSELTSAEIGAIQSEIRRLSAEIVTLEDERKALREEIIGIISAFEAITSTTPSITPLTMTGDYLSWNELVQKANEYNKLPVTHNLFDALTIKDENGNVVRDGEKYFNSVISSVRRQHTGSDKTYFTTLALVDLCLEAGVRLEYDHAGTGTGGVKTYDRNLRVPVPSKTVSTGTDCNAIASWLIFGDDSPYATWLSVGEFGSSVPRMDRQQAIPGDAFAINTKTTGHVGIIMGYNPSTDEYLIYQGSGQAADHNMMVVSGDTFDSKGYTVRRVDSSWCPPWYQTTV